MTETLRTIAGDKRILAALERGPQGVREIEHFLLVELLDAWADENGYQIEWGSKQEPFGARLLAFHTTDERGIVHLRADQIRGRLLKFERRGLVTRVSVTPRKTLWALAP